MKRAAIYARVSTDEQGKGYSLQTQIEACKEYARKYSYKVIEVCADTFTGTELDRPGLSKLYECIDTMKIDSLLVYDIDRLSREVGHQAIIEMELNNKGVQIEYVLGGYDNSPEGELMKIVKSGIAQYENRQRVERSRRGKIGKAKAGYVICPAGRAPFGYRYISEDHKGRFEVIEDQAKVVRLMYSWLIDDGMSSYAIAKKLWEEGIMSKGDFSHVVTKKSGRGEWSPSTVRRIISNQVYMGLWHYNKTRRQKLNGKVRYSKVPESEWITVPVPAIVDKKTWEKAQKCLQKNQQRSKRNTKRKYLLRSFVFCPCGRRWTCLYKTHLKRAYYRCPSNEAEHWRKKCDNRFSIRQGILEENVWECVKGILLNPENLLNEIKHKRQKAENDNVKLKFRLNSINDAIDMVDKKLGVLLDELLEGTFTRTVINQRRDELVNQRGDLEAEVRRIQGEMDSEIITYDQEAELLEFSYEIKNRLKKPTFEQKRRLFELLDIRVDVIARDQIKVSGVIDDGLIVNLSSA